MFLSGCKPQPDDPIKPDQDYTLTIQGTSSLDKKIQDGTTAWFVEKGKTDTTFKALQNEQASLKIHAAEGRSVQGTAGIRENNGHQGAQEAIFLEQNTMLPLIMTAKQHAIMINYTITGNNNPVNKAIIITPQETTRTNAEGKGITTVANVSTDQYNNIAHTLEGRIESDEQTSIRFDPRTFTYTLITTTKDVTEDVNEKNYYSTITIDGNIAGALLYVLHETDTIAKKTADTAGNGTLNIERTQETYNVTVGANKTGYIKDEETITLQGEQNYNINLTLNQANYTKTINFTITSSETTKTPKSFRGYVLVSGDTLAVTNFNGNTGQLHYNTNNASEQAEIGATSIPAHQEVKTNMTLTGTHNFNRTATIIYQNSNVPILVVGERGLPINGVSITGFGSAKTTGTDGKTNLEMILGADKTDANGLPYTNYTTNINLASEDIINQTTSIQHTPGNNTQKNITAKRTNYPYIVNFNVASSDPTKTPLGFTGSIIINGQTIATNNYTSTNGQLTFNNPAPNLNAQATATNIPYHSNAPTQNTTLDGNDNINLVANADINYYNVTGRVSQEGTGNGVQANVTTEGKNDDTDVSGNYAINNITQRRGNNNQPLTYTIDIIATGGFDTQTKQATADGTNKTINFTIPVVTNEYNISGRGHLIGAIISELPNEAMDYLKTGSIRFTTKKDNQEHDININTQGYFNGEITGPYTLTDTILIDFVNNPLATTNTFSFLDGSKVASTGKIRNNDGSYVASANEPRFTQYDAWTTIEKLEGKNLVFIAFSNQAYNLPDDLMNINGPPNHGIISYINDNVTFYNDTINHSTLSPISAQNKQDQDDAINFLRNQLTTRTGLTLVNHNKIYGNNNWTQPQGICYIYKSEGQAGNSKVGDTPNTFYRSMAHTRSTEGFNLIVTEGNTAQNGSYDLLSGNGANLYVWDATGRITGLSWEGNVSKDASYLFPEAFFKKIE